MPDHIHRRERLEDRDVVIFDCSHQSNIMLTDDANCRDDKAGRRFSYHGGHYTKFPVEIAAPHSGHWNIVIDLGGGSANIRYSVSVAKCG